MYVCDFEGANRIGIAAAVAVWNFLDVLVLRPGPMVAVEVYEAELSLPIILADGQARAEELVIEPDVGVVYIRCVVEGGITAPLFDHIAVQLRRRIEEGRFQHPGKVTVKCCFHQDFQGALPAEVLLADRMDVFRVAADVFPYLVVGQEAEAQRVGVEADLVSGCSHRREESAI